ncbi:hypothetical protein JX266_002631 [Neoarthrinium moseri]|nr:hypothetical protein JX266_002631 [Neoarthrinium moseri]
MVLRQLQLPRSLTARTIAAAWRPVLRGQGRGPRSLRARFSTTTRRWSSSDKTDTQQVSPPPQRQQRQARDEEGPEKPQEKSLFARLFPDEAKQRAAASSQVQRSSTWASQLRSPLGPAEPGSAEAAAADEALRHAPRQITYVDVDADRDRDTSAMVVLGAASKHLNESDFYRVGATQSRHVAGWVAGLRRVVPARDPHTLDPLGHYYVLFDSRAAAAAWCEEARRLWALAKQTTPGVGRRPGSQYRGVLPQGDATRRDAESFTLVSPAGRWDLEIVDAYTQVQRVLERSGDIVDKLRRRAGSRFLVLVVVDGGRMSVDMLRAAIREDGAERNLAWRVMNLEGDGRSGEHGQGGIFPFGRSGLKSADKLGIEQALQEQAMRTMSGPAGKDEGEVEEQDIEEQREDGADAAMAQDPWTVVPGMEEQRSYPRFIVPFLDEAEARRFVRNWHRRQLTLRMGQPGVDAVEWEESRTLNVSYLW